MNNEKQPVDPCCDLFAWLGCMRSVGGAQHPQCTGPGDGSQQGQAVVHHQLQGRREGASQLPPGQPLILLPVLPIRDILLRIRIRGPMAPDPYPAIFVLDLQDDTKIIYFYQSFSAYCFLKVHLHHFSKTKSPDFSVYVQNPRIFYKIMKIYTFTVYTKSKVDTQKNIKFES
jgi:hypothetical protein